MNNIKAIFIKQLTSQLKVPSIIIQGIMFLVIAGAMMFFMTPDEEHDCDYCVPAYVCAPCEYEESNRFQIRVLSGLGIFTVIFIGLALVGSSSALVAEDKSTTNLRFMAMADVRPYQYLIATVGAIIIVVAGMLIFYGLFGGYLRSNPLEFMAVGIAGGLVSIMLGIVIGLSKYPVLGMPVSIILGLGPTIGNFNEAFANATRFTFIQQVNLALYDLNAVTATNFLIIGANAAVILAVFALMHRRNRFNV